MRSAKLATAPSALQTRALAKYAHLHTQILVPHAISVLLMNIFQGPARLKLVALVLSIVKHAQMDHLVLSAVQDLCITLPIANANQMQILGVAMKVVPPVVKIHLSFALSVRTAAFASRQKVFAKNVHLQLFQEIVQKMYWIFNP